MIVDDSEDGPYDVLHWIRFMLGERGVSPKRRYIFEQGAELNFWWNLHYQIYRAISCIWCMSFWLGLLFGITYLIVPTITLLVLFPFALSAGSLVVIGLVKREK